jgi:hypothetical protein
MYTGVRARFINVFNKNLLFLGMSLNAMPLYVKGEVGTTYLASIKYFEWEELGSHPDKISIHRTK